MSGSSSQNGNAGSFNTFATENDWNTETSPARMVEQVTAIVKKFLQEVGVPHVRVLTAGEATISPATLWASPFIAEIISALRQEADLIVIDTPPVIGMPDAGFVARQADGILLCVEAGKTERTLLQRAPRLLELSKEKIWGVILNKVDPAAIYGSYKHYKYYVKHYHRPRIRQKA
jgi:Mrp family chromosome partitioning ATPase